MSMAQRAVEQPLEAWVRPGSRIDPWLSLSPLRHGHGDPTIRFEPRAIWRATRTESGPATMRIETFGEAFRVQAWGPGRHHLVESAGRMLGEDDRPEALVGTSGIVRNLQRRLAGLRFGRTDAVFESLLPAIIEQKVTGIEARHAYRGLIRTFGEWAPGPGRLRLAPSPERLRALPYWVFHPFGLEQNRADTIRRAAARSRELEAAGSLPPETALDRLRSVPGVGAWTAAETARSAFGDPDAVSVGDYHLPNLVCWLLAGEPRGDDARMLELLEPYRGQRARVVRLLELSGLGPPRWGPRMAPRSIAGF